MEKATVKHAIMSLATDDPSVMGKYKYVANWVSVVHLGGCRGRLQVSTFIRSLVKECHAKAVERGATVHPGPTSLLLTQDLDTNSEVEAKRDDAPKGSAVHTQGGAYTRRCTHNAVHTQGGPWPLSESRF